MPNRSFTSSFRKSLLLACLLMVAAQALLYRLDLPSPEFYGGFDCVGRKFRDLERFGKRGPIDVLVVGDSRIVVGLDAGRLETLTGLRTYNCGLFGTNLHCQSLFVRDYLVPRYRPRFILWHMSLLVGSRPNINRGITDSHAFALLRFQHGHRFLRIAGSFVPYQRRPIEGWVEAIVNCHRRDHDNRELLSKVACGANRKPARMPPAEETRSPQIAEWQFPLKRKRGGASPPPTSAGSSSEYRGDEIWNVFREAIEAARREGVRIIACTAPYRSDIYRSSFSGSADDGNGFFANADKIQALIDEYEIPYVNYQFYAPVSEHDALFLDGTHLNHLGAEILTDRVAHHFFLRDEAVPGDLQGTVSDAEQQFIAQLRDLNASR